jgi:uncharacterized protein with ParB-like and HNH nuclease domain
MIDRYQIQKTFYKISDFISWQKSGQLVLSPEFQRRPVWKAGAKSYLIDTIHKGLPIPIIFIRDRRTDPDKIEPMREVIDGQQRIRTVISYIAPKLLKDFDPSRDVFDIKRTHNKELAGKSFKQLDDDTKRAILDYEFSVHILPSFVDDREVIQIFRRMNSTTYGLTKQELRNSEFFGEFKSAAYSLAAEQLERWRRWKTFTEQDIARMSEVEHTSECLILIISGKLSGKSSAKISYFYKKYDDNLRERKEIENRFRTVMDFIDSHFQTGPGGFMLCRKKTLYTFFVFIYDLLFGLEQLKAGSSKKPKVISHHTISRIVEANDRIRDRTAPSPVLESTDRRTTNPKERSILFSFLKDSIA